MRLKLWVAGWACLLMGTASATESDSRGPEKVVLPAAMQAAISSFTACVLKDRRRVLPLSDELIRSNLCGVYLPYDAAKLKWFKNCLRIAGPVALESAGFVVGDKRVFMVDLRCTKQLPDLSLDLLETPNGFVVRRVLEIVS